MGETGCLKRIGWYVFSVFFQYLENKKKLFSFLEAKSKISQRVRQPMMSDTGENSTVPTSGTVNFLNNQKDKIEDEHKRKFEADKKKEHDEKVKARPQDKSRPISSTPISGTPW